MPVFGAVDIGSNSVRLSIAELRRGRLVVLHQDREVTRLGEGVFRDGNLEPQAMAQTLKVLRRFHGAVRLTQEFIHHDPPTKPELKRLHDFIVQEAANASRKITRAAVRAVIATSGTAAALAGAAQS